MQMLQKKEISFQSLRNAYVYIHKHIYVCDADRWIFCEWNQSSAEFLLQHSTN